MAKTNINTKTAEQVEKTPEQITKEHGARVTELMKLHDNVKSKVIRQLSAENLTVSQINKGFESAGIKMRYQHVRNVLTQPKKAKKD